MGTQSKRCMTTSRGRAASPQRSSDSNNFNVWGIVTLVVWLHTRNRTSWLLGSVVSWITLMIIGCSSSCGLLLDVPHCRQRSPCPSLPREHVLLFSCPFLLPHTASLYKFFSLPTRLTSRRYFEVANRSFHRTQEKCPGVYLGYSCMMCSMI